MMASITEAGRAASERWKGVASEHGQAPADFSLEREVRTQHRRLDALFANARDALQAGDAPVAAREALAALRGALDAHFEQEDRLYYPTIWSLRPEQKPGLLAAVDAHQDFRARLGRIEGRIDDGELEQARAGFAELAAAFARHEREEERILDALDRERAAR
jgi:hypothetical protein